MEKNLVDKWQNHKTFYEEMAVKNIRCMHLFNTAERKKSFIEALAFWNFIFANIPWNHNNIAWMEWMKRREALIPFLAIDNPRIIVVAAIESLPDLVWKKVLSKYNIPFDSQECFLCKLRFSQILAVLENYHDLCVNKVPPAFSSLDRFLTDVSVENIFSEEWDYSRRY